MSSIKHVVISALTLILLWATDLYAENVDPESLGLHWTWSANAGWLDAQPGGPGAYGLHAEDNTVSGWMWSPNVGWISANCSNTASCGEVVFGLELVPDPVKPGWLLIVGHAWSENAGWIVSHCLTTDSCDETDYGLRVEISSGLVEGYAWSQNLGWLNFACANTSTCGTVSFGLQFDPSTLLPGGHGIFKDGFETGT